MPEDTSLGGPRRDFPTTAWSDVLHAGDPTSPECGRRLNRLLAEYWKPVYAYIRAAWHKPVEEAKDLTQAFFAHVLEKQYLARLRPEMGSFRGYLRQALKHFLVDARRREEVRRPALPVVHLGAQPGDWDGVPAEGIEPERAFDLAWFRSLMDSAIQDLRRALVAEEKALHFDVFRSYCLEAGEAPPTYAEIASRYGLKETDVHNYLTFTRKTLRDFLRLRIREYVASEDEVERELREAVGG